jgi:hypothetical protein
MKTKPYNDTVIRILSPEMAAEKLDWTLAAVLKRREELGLGPFVGRRNARPRPKAMASATGEPAIAKAAKRKPVKRLAAVGV